MARPEQIRKLADRGGTRRVRGQLHGRAPIPGCRGLAEDDRRHRVHDPSGHPPRGWLGHEPHRGLGAHSQAVRARIQGRVHALGRNPRGVRGHVLEARAPAHALGGRPHLQRQEVVSADHAVTLRLTAREGRVPVRRGLLPASGALRLWHFQLAPVRSAVPGPHPRMDSGARVLSFALVPFQGWAALKGPVEKEEGPWFRTPKTGVITDPVKHLRRLHLLRRWLLGSRGGYARKPVAVPKGTSPSHARGQLPTRWIGWFVAGSMLVAF